MDFFSDIINFIGSAVSFVWQTITGVIRLISLIPEGTAALTNAVGYLPSIIATFAATTITISVIFIIVGRNGGGQK